MEKEKLASTSQSEGGPNNKNVKPELVSLVFELGFIIAIPIALLALGGRLLDKHLNTSPLFILVGIGLAIFLTSFLVYKRITKILY